MISIGPYTIRTIPFGTFRLDGGAMFGSVPKTLWSRTIAVDEDNCIPLAARGLLIEGEGRCILVDTGCGDKWSEKLKGIFQISTTPLTTLPFDAKEVSDVILTHLHFDHAGGVSHYQGDSIALTYPGATHWLQKKNWEIACNPSQREQASYLHDNVAPLKEADLQLIEGEKELFPGVSVYPIEGHTEGQQWIKISDGSTTAVFATDLIPTSRHLPLPYVMGYDLCARTTLREKESFLKQAVEEEWIVIYQHDPDTTASTVTTNERGHFCVKERIEV